MTGGVVWDGRWVGNHGIARHAAEVSSRLSVPMARMGRGRIAPASPADPAYLLARLSAARCRLFVSPGFSASLPGHYQQLLTVHDLIHLRVREEAGSLRRLYYERIVRPAIRRTQRVLTVSEATQRELAEWAGLREENVVVVGNGSSVAFATAEELLAAEPQRRDVLLVGNARPHKNLGLAFGALRHLPPDVRLVTVGISASEARRLAVIHGIDSVRVEVHEQVDAHRLRELYLRARCVGLPSTHEGFGLPAVEAMAVGTPTAFVCAAVAEVVGDLGFRAASRSDPAVFADVLREAMAMPAAKRSDLVARAAMFTWQSVADRVQAQIIGLAGQS